MAERDPSQMSLPDLIAALLLYGGVGHSARATAILAELRRRTGQDFGANPQAWWNWFLPTHPLDKAALQFADTRRRIRDIERRALRKLRR